MTTLSKELILLHGRYCSNFLLQVHLPTLYCVYVINGKYTVYILVFALRL